MLHMIRARCVAHDLHMLAPGPFEHTCCRQLTAQRGDCKKSQIALLNEIIFIIIIIIIIIIITTCLKTEPMLLKALLTEGVRAMERVVEPEE